MKTHDDNAVRPRRRYWRIVGFLVLLIAALNVIGLIPGFCDFYATGIYPVLTDPLSRLCDQTRLPVGELLMFAGIALVLTAAVILVALLALRKHRGFARAARGYLKLVLFVVLCTLLLFTLNYLLPFRATPLVRAYTPDGAEYTLEQLEAVRTQLVEDLNKTAESAPRDDQGHLSHADRDAVNAQTAEALQQLGGEFPRLSGFYPAPKAAWCSDVLEWMNIGGYTYPYTMEVTYNRYVSNLYFPVLATHESIHHKGFYLESEAVFLSFLACVRSDDALLRYSGYEHMYHYVEDAYVTQLISTFGKGKAKERYEAQVQLSDTVKADILHDAEERSRAYEAGVDKRAEEAFSDAAKGAADYGWNAQGQILQGNSYSGAVELLLAYSYTD